MKTNKHFLTPLTVLLTALIASCTNMDNKLPNSNTTTTLPQTTNQVDLTRYIGTWYEVARIPMFFQRKCVSDVSAKYQALPDGSVSVLNTCLDENGQSIQAIGRAEVDKKFASNNSKLLVSFMPDWLQWLSVAKGGYWVLALDGDYQYALVGSPNRKYLWVLSRTPNMPNEVYQNYLNIAKQQGYNIDSLIKTPHTQQ